MPSKIDVADGKATITFWWTALIAIAQHKIDKAAKYFWLHGSAEYDEDGNMIEFDTLTNQQKVGVLGRHFLTVIYNAAAQQVCDEQDADRIAAIEEERAIVFE